MSDDKKMQGKIKTVNSKGFGFIVTEAHIDYFFHYTAFNGNWKKLVASFVNQTQFHEGNGLKLKRPQIKVSFDIDKTAVDAPRAINVSLIE